MDRKRGVQRMNEIFGLFEEFIFNEVLINDENEAEEMKKWLRVANDLDVD